MLVVRSEKLTWLSSSKELSYRLVGSSMFVFFCRGVRGLVGRLLSRYMVIVGGRVGTDPGLHCGDLPDAARKGKHTC